RHIEYPIHTEIMRARPDVGCTVHTHAPALSAFACLDVPLLPISHDGVLFCDPPVPRFTRTGALIATAELGAALAGTLGDARACLMPSHGAVTAVAALRLERRGGTRLRAQAARARRAGSARGDAARRREGIWPPGRGAAAGQSGLKPRGGHSTSGESGKENKKTVPPQV